MNRRTVYSVVGAAVAAAVYFLKNSFKPVDIVNELATKPGASYGKRSLNNITHIVIHHTATLSTLAGSNPYSIANFHTWDQGPYNFPGIGYHIVIQPDGTVYLTNYLDTVSYHVGTLNPNSVGICISGNFDQEQFTDTQYKALIKAINYVHRKTGKKLIVEGHRRYANKTCPGHNCYARINDIRNATGGKTP